MISRIKASLPSVLQDTLAVGRGIAYAWTITAHERQRTLGRRPLPSRVL